MSVLRSPAALPFGHEPDPDRDGATVEAVEAAIDHTLGSLRERWAHLAAAVVPRVGVLHTDSVLELLEATVHSGGKRFRPRMAHWGWVAAGGHRSGTGHNELVTVGAALELLHVFALIHDDVMDASPTRRGQPSVHASARAQHEALGGHGDPQRYGENIAILAGDLAHSEADLLVATLPPRLQGLWRTLSIELMVGQGRDLVGAANGRRDLAHAREVARAKSGAYTVWRPLQLGATAGGAGPRTLAALERYGTGVGEAFALRDDILGVVGDPRATGKPVGEDIVAGKPTVLMALATERFSPRWRRALERAGRSARPSSALVAGLAAEFVRSGVIADAEQMIEDAVHSAMAALEDPAIDPDAAGGLAALARRVAWRDA
ncbi:MAG: polyprenyl synthetase family protein [Propionicimonas sp.]|uniref:polyprenyl synthetase family protein n=1 Tax=Propionicimonas sp. TaxID=1955623 RepID=UPI003D0D2325